MRFCRESLQKSIPDFLAFCRVAATTVLLLALPAVAGDGPVAGMKWLSGCWASVDGEPGSGEQWMAPAGRSMFGISRTVRDGTTVAFEFMRIAEDEHGKVVFVALPSGQKPTTFELISLSENEVVFENPEHDFPQRVIYRLMPGNRLTGRIEGTVNGTARHVDFPMMKSHCESGDSG
jgi:hypothetical protein